VSFLGVIGFIYERHDIGTAKGISISIGIGLWLILAASLVAGGTAIHEITEKTPIPEFAQKLPPAAQRYWWGIGMVVVLFIGTIAYGQVHHDTEGLGIDSSSGGLDVDTGAGLDGAPTADPTDCAGKGDTSLTADARDLNSFAEGSGSVTVQLLKTRALPHSFQDNFVDETVTADGKFVGVQLKVTNRSSAEIQPSSMFDSWRLTDGDASWETADYSGSHQGGVSGAYSDSQGDDQPETEVAAGFDGTTWAVFDIPLDADPSAIAVSSTPDQTCLRLP
jgi:hypothetical protein